MEDLIYTMVLSDGTIIENLRKNGDNYISASKLTADMFEGKLSEVTVKTSEHERWKHRHTAFQTLRPVPVLKIPEP